MRYIPIVKFFSEEFVDVASTALPALADDETRSTDALIEEDARIKEEIRALRKWDVL